MRCSSWCDRRARATAAALAACALLGCGRSGAPAAEPAGPVADLYVPPGGCSGPDEERILSWGDRLEAVHPGCLRLPDDARGKPLRIACAKTITDPVWVDARRLAPAEKNPCADGEASHR